MTPALRQDVIETVLAYVKDRDRDIPLKILSFGSGQLGIEYLLIQFLKLQGFKQLELFAVDHIYAEPKVDALVCRKDLAICLSRTISDFFSIEDKLDEMVSEVLLCIDGLVSDCSKSICSPMRTISFASNLKESFLKSVTSDDFLAKYKLTANSSKACIGEVDFFFKLLDYVRDGVYAYFNKNSLNFFSSIEGLSFTKQACMPNVESFRTGILIKIDAPNAITHDRYEQACFTPPRKPLLVLDYGPYRLVNEY